jgi:hypothetical protein
MMGFGSFFKSSIFGKSKKEVGTYNLYMSKHKIELKEIRECPICLLEFESNDQVQGLQCSKMHIYHKECLKNMVNNGERKCAMCR